MANLSYFSEAKSSVIKAHGGAVRTVAFSYDGQCLLTGSDDKTIKVLYIYFVHVGALSERRLHSLCIKTNY